MYGSKRVYDNYTKTGNLYETIDSTVDVRQSRARESSPVVQEAIRTVMQRLSMNGKVDVTKRHVSIALFLAKERLPDDNRVKHDLAYYWYREGPYSEVVHANLDHMAANGLVHKVPSMDAYRLASARIPVASGDDLDVARRKIH